MVWQNENLDDLVLLRSDGTPTYMLAVVVDDHDMDVTHIIRGDDHLTNAARQKQIYDALGWPVPVMAHIPLIHGPDGSKLSKRHGALGVDAYRAMGYLPVALRNYLVRLGWAHGDQEIFSTEEMIAAFDLPQIGRSPARFDFAKLESLNGHYIRQSADADLLAAIDQLLPHIADGAKLAAKMTPDLRRQWLDGHAKLEGARQDACSSLLMAQVSPGRPAARSGRQGGRPADARKRKTLLAEIAAGAGRRRALDRRSDRAGGPHLCRAQGRKARRRGAAAAGGADRPHDLARIFEVLAVLGKAESLARLAIRPARNSA